MIKIKEARHYAVPLFSYKQHKILVCYKNTVIALFFIQNTIEKSVLP